MYCKVGRGLNIEILDSLNFLNMQLDNFPKSFALKKMKKKAIFHTCTIHITILQC